MSSPKDNSIRGICRALHGITTAIEYYNETDNGNGETPRSRNLTSLEDSCSTCSDSPPLEGDKMPFEIYFRDLNEKAQRRILEWAQLESPSEASWDTFPITSVDDSEVVGWEE